MSEVSTMRTLIIALLLLLVVYLLWVHLPAVGLQTLNTIPAA